MRPRILAPLSLSLLLSFPLFFTATNTYAAESPVVEVFDVDGNGEKEALTDGLLLIRYLFGFRNDSLIANAIGIRANTSSSTARKPQSAVIIFYLFFILPYI